MFGRVPLGRAIRYKSSLRCGLYAAIPHATAVCEDTNSGVIVLNGEECLGVPFEVCEDTNCGGNKTVALNNKLVLSRWLCPNNEPLKYHCVRDCSGNPFMLSPLFVSSQTTYNFHYAIWTCLFLYRNHQKLALYNSAALLATNNPSITSTSDC